MATLVSAEDCTLCDSEETGQHEPGCENHPGNNLTPDEIKLPALYAQEKLGLEAIVHIKLFLPGSGWTWYITEYDPEEERAFGLVVGHEKELGYISVAELRALRVQGMFRVERDLWFQPITLREARAIHA